MFTNQPARPVNEESVVIVYRLCASNGCCAAAANATAPVIQKRIHLRLIALLMCVGVLGSGMKGSAESANLADYKLGTMDKVRLKVFEWRASRDEVFEWKALNDDYVIGPSGKLSLPLIGEVLATGASPGELASEIGVRLKNRIGLAESPDISVEVVQFRPFYILGHVEHPGEYAYRPNLTVLQAVSIAGGMPRKDAATLRLEREAIAGNGDVQVLRADARALVARKARLDADIGDATEISFPKSLDGDKEGVASIKLQEEAIFRSNKFAFDAQLASLNQLKTFLETEVQSLAGQLETHLAEAKLAKKELVDVSDLVDRKLAVQPRRLAAQRNVYQLDGDRLRLEMNLVKARQEISKTDYAISELRSKRSNEMTTELRDTQTKLDQVLSKLATASELLEDTTSESPEARDEAKSGGSKSLVYSIVRTPSGEPLEISATETTPVLPGDTIKAAVQRVVEPATVSAPGSAKRRLLTSVNDEVVPMMPGEAQKKAQ
jgi:protein involved in polysaccharide export with SLBB domain